jgi:putative ATP-dependent endonuclease of the OLD family
MPFDDIHIKNYKCFDDEGCIIKDLNQINVIIGKNNTGKSSVLEVIQQIVENKPEFNNNSRNGKPPEITLKHKIRKELLEKMINRNPHHYSNLNLNAYVDFFDKELINYKYNQHHSKEIFAGIKEIPYVLNVNTYPNEMITGLDNKTYKHLSAERDLTPELKSIDHKINVNGVGATNYIEQIINKANLESNLIEKDLLKELNIILNPDIEVKRIVIQENSNNIWEINLDIGDSRIPLSKMGSGIKTVLLVLLLTNVVPKIEQNEIKDYVFALEELENNLHPSMQRRLYKYLHEFALRNDCILFITTHSNIVIDLFSTLKNTQLFHIQQENLKTSINSAVLDTELKGILNDMDYKASDILQSNGILWVEGPSDRTYINKWIAIANNGVPLIEGYHYSFMFYGGRLLSHISFENDFLTNDLISLLRLNRNAFVIIDRDGKSINAKLNATKERIQVEIGENVWITKGREIENYLTKRNLEAWLNAKLIVSSDIILDSNTKLEDSIATIPSASKIKYNVSKTKYAKEIIEHINEADMDFLDL